MAGAGAVLRNCTATITKQLGARAQTDQQQQAVSDLRTACNDVAKAHGNGDTAAAGTYAKNAYEAGQQAGQDVK